MTMRISTLLLSVMVLAGCSHTIEDALTARDANEVVVVLQAHGVHADRQPSGEHWRVEVPRAQARQSLAILVHHGLPRREQPLPDLSSGGLVPSAEEERGRRLRSATTSLERTFLAIDGVLDARVHAVLPEPTRRRAEPSPSGRAAVMLVHRSGMVLPSDDIIRAMVIGSIEGLAPDAVTVVRNERTLPAPPDLSIVPVGPLLVAEDSARALTILVSTLLVSVLLLAVLLLRAVTRTTPAEVHS